VTLNWASAVINSPQEGLNVNCTVGFVIDEHEAGKLQITIIKFYFSRGWVGVSCIAFEGVVKRRSSE
jgi:hypothetical protein